jgi:hypothetical protein
MRGTYTPVAQQPANLMTIRMKDEEVKMQAAKRFVIACVLSGLSAFSTAGTGEFCSFPNLPAAPVTYECAIKINPGSSWLTQFNNWLALNKTSGAMACFGAGTYVVPSVVAPDTAPYSTNDTNRFVLRGAQNLRLCAPSGGAIFQGKTVNATGTQLTDYAWSATFKVVDSTGVSVKGLEFVNKSDYSMTFPHHVMRAIEVENSTGVTFIGGKASSIGKQSVNINDSTVSFSASTFNCAYFCISAERGSGTVTKPVISIAGSGFNINHARNLADDHPALYTNSSDFNISDSNFNFVTGEGFVAGTATTVDWVNLTNITITGLTAQGRLKMFGWIPTHPNYFNVQISYTGTLPPGRPYYCVSFAGSQGCDTGFENAGNQGAIFKYRANAASAFVSALPPPNKVKKILLVNASGVDSVWSQQSIVKNQANLLFRAQQAWSSMGAGLGGWLDSDDGVLSGDFLVAGQQRVLFFNSETLGGAFSIRSLTDVSGAGSMTTEAVVDWSPTLQQKLAGFHDAGDKLLAGDFTGMGRSQVLFFNTAGFDAAFQVAAIDGATSSLQTVTFIPWTAALSSSLTGWMDVGDKLVSGDFAGTGKAQLMFMNTVGGTQGAASLRQYDTATNAFQVLNTVPWTKISGNSAVWKNQSIKTLVGDFLGLGRDQLLVLNPSGTGTAISVWSFDALTGTFTEIHKMNWSTTEIPNLNGFRDNNDLAVSSLKRDT